MDQLESLLNDLQSSTIAYRQAHRFDSADCYPPTNSSSDNDSLGVRFNDSPLTGHRPNNNGMAASTASTSVVSYAEHGLQDLEKLLDDYSLHRGKNQTGRPTVDSLLGELDTALPCQPSPIRQTVSATNAGKDLDNLMSCLAEYKIRTITKKTTKTTEKTCSPQAGRQTPASTTVETTTVTSTTPLSSPSTNQLLDTSLSSSQQQSSTITTFSPTFSTKPQESLTTTTGTARGDCGACGQKIVGQVVIALDKMWHPEHFTCSTCHTELGHKNFFERSGHIYCENDYHNLFSPRCAYCNSPIKGRCVTALGKTWHPEHFFCATCGKQFGDEGFHEKDGRAYCRADFFGAFAPRCRGCKQAIIDSYITALNNHWHPDCFVCQECRQPFSAGSFFDHEDQPYCETHFHEKRGSLCSSCSQAISGKCITAMGRKFHPHHFVCSFCLQQLNKGTFKEHQSKPYCHKCFGKLLQ